MRRHKLAVKVFSNTLFQLIGKVITMSVTIFSTIVITRSFGREGYGWFNIMQTFPALFYIIADFGMNDFPTFNRNFPLLFTSLRTSKTQNFPSFFKTLAISSKTFLGSLQ